MWSLRDEETMDTLKITSDRPLAGYRIIQALNSGPKLTIIRALINNSEGLTAKEIAKLLGVKLPTIMEHLSDLIKTGLVRINYEGRHKRYVLQAKKVLFEIDLPLFLSLIERKDEAELRELEFMAVEYLKKKIAGEGLPMNITVKDVARTLGVDTSTAIGIVDFINTYPEKIIHFIEQMIIQELLNNQSSLTLGELSKKINIHKYWLILAVQSLVSKAIVKLEDELVELVS